jgi:hypothetical protein
MLQHETTKDRRILPKPLALTPSEIQQVAAGTAASLKEQAERYMGATIGIWWGPEGPPDLVLL